MKNLITKFRTTTTTTVVLLCCFYILGLGLGQTLTVPDNLLMELKLPAALLAGAEQPGPVVGEVTRFLDDAPGIAEPIRLAKLGGLPAQPPLPEGVLDALSTIPGLPFLAKTGTNIAVQCANCTGGAGDSPVFKVVGESLLTGGTFTEDRVFQIGNTDLPDTYKLRYCPTGRGSCRDVVFSANKLMVDNGRLEDYRPLHLVRELGTIHPNP